MSNENEIIEKSITKTAHLGDAGTPVDIEINFGYTVDKFGSVVIHWSEDTGGPENLPKWWAEQIKEFIEEEFESEITFL